jgi:hypothetical protein
MAHEHIPKEFYDAVETAARGSARKWPTLDWEDVRQDVWVYLMENAPEMEKLLKEEDPSTQLRRISGQRAAMAADVYEFFSGQYEYGTDEVRVLLEMGLITNREAATLTESTDLSTGMLMLQAKNLSQFDAIVDRYVHGIPSPDKTAAKVVERAVDGLTVLMNRVNTSSRYTDHQGPGARKSGDYHGGT